MKAVVLDSESFVKMAILMTKHFQHQQTADLDSVASVAFLKKPYLF